MVHSPLEEFTDRSDQTLTPLGGPPKGLTCPQDCGFCPGCPNGLCGPTENCANCMPDCCP